MYFQKSYFKTAKKTNYDGYIYMSKFEANQAAELDLRKKAGEVLKWDRQVKIPLVVNGYLICNYYIDFVAYLADGTTEYIEAKGLAMPAWILKWKLFEALYSGDPNNKLIVVFQGKGKRPKPKKLKL